MEKEQVLAWQKGFQSLHEATREKVRRTPLDLKKSVRLAISLIDFCRERDSWTDSAKNTIRMREVAEVQERWIRLKQVYQK